MPWIAEDGLRLDHMLAVQPWTQWLTLLFQVMPVFFLVGGYSNAASWDAAQRSGTPYGNWVAGRSRRLIGPVVPLILAWAAIAFVFRRFGVSYEMIKHGSILALVPMWFLAVYLLVVLLVPVTRAAWRRFGVRSYWLPVALAVVVDVLLLALGAAQTGLVLALEGPMRRLLDGQRAWAATVLVNGTIMTVYLWHLTVLALLVGLAHLAGGIGLRWPPGGSQWWWARIPWFLALGAGLAVLLPLVGRFERSPALPVGFRPSTTRVLAGTIVGAWLLGAIGTRWSSA